MQGAGAGGGVVAVALAVAPCFCGQESPLADSSPSLSLSAQS